jgi:hypothetical protein
VPCIGTLRQSMIVSQQNPMLRLFRI